MCKIITRNLYIIGNGFDLYHGLDTKYQSFASFLKDSNWEVYDLAIEYYYLPDIAHQDDIEDDEYNAWSKFEEALANLDYEQVLEDKSDSAANLYDPDFRDRDWNTYQIEMEMIVDKLTNDLKSIFKEFILKINYPNYENIQDKIINIEKNSLFLNFNYTITLEKYYNISNDKICYIHNKANDDDGNDLILGHGISPEVFKPTEIKPPDNLTDEELELWREEMSNQYDLSYDMAKEEILSYYKKSFKNTDEIINNKKHFFKQLTNIDTVYVLGHSISEVDLKYFIKIKKSIKKNAIWNISYHSEKEKDKHFETLVKIGVERTKINQIKIKELK